MPGALSSEMSVRLVTQQRGAALPGPGEFWDFSWQHFTGLQGSALAPSVGLPSEYFVFLTL